MKKIILTYLLCVLITPLCYAQGKIPSPKARKVTSLATLKKTTVAKLRAPFRISVRRRLLQNPSRVTTILERRAKESVQRAQIAREVVANTFGFNTGLYETNILVSAQTALTPEFFKDLYPSVEPFITDSTQAEQYIIASNNRRASVQEKKMAQVRQKIEQSIPQLKEALLPVTQSASEDISSLIQQVAPDTNYVLLGEFHHSSAIIGQMGKTLQALREQFPNRKIILMTEVLYEGTSLDPKDVVEVEPFLTHYLPLLETAQKLQMPVRGLELRQLKNQPLFRYDGSSVNTFDATTEAVTVRNQRWLEQIQRVHKQNPDALVVIHSGLLHLDYIYPNSIGATLKKEDGHTFLAAFVPGYESFNSFPGISSYMLLFPWMKDLHIKSGEFLPFSNFDLVSQGIFPQRIVQFKDENGNNFSDITGFDVQIKVPGN
ncbi:MAG: hypothetical protein J6X06_02105 [Elusimicrobiaceae bacterium]|nr:hypothetical protein [Elusimicrobiaceae bacterium]